MKIFGIRAVFVAATMALAFVGRGSFADDFSDSREELFLGLVGGPPAELNATTERILSDLSNGIWQWSGDLIYAFYPAKGRRRCELHKNGTFTFKFIPITSQRGVRGARVEFSQSARVSVVNLQNDYDPDCESMFEDYKKRSRQSPVVELELLPVTEFDAQSWVFRLQNEKERRYGIRAMGLDGLKICRYDTASGDEDDPNQDRIQYCLPLTRHQP